MRRFIDIDNLGNKLDITFIPVESIGKTKRPLCRHFLLPIIEYIKLRCRQQDVRLSVNCIRIHITAIKLCNIHEQAQRHIFIARALMLQQNNMLFLDNKAHIVPYACEKRPIQSRKLYIMRTYRVIQQSRIDFCQTFLVVEYIPK